MPAPDAEENRLALAVCSVDNSTRRAALRGVGGLDHAKGATSFFEFVSEQVCKRGPALFKDGAVQSSFLPDPAPRLAWSAK